MSARRDYNDQLLLFTDVPVDLRRQVNQQAKSKLPQRKFKSQFRQSAQSEVLTQEVVQKLTESYRSVMSRAQQNKEQVFKTAVSLEDSITTSQFEPAK